MYGLPFTQGKIRLVKLWYTISYCKQDYGDQVKWLSERDHGINFIEQVSSGSQGRVSRNSTSERDY